MIVTPPSSSCKDKRVLSLSQFHVDFFTMLASRKGGRGGRLRKICIETFRVNGLQLRADAMAFLEDQFAEVRANQSHSTRTHTHTHIHIFPSPCSSQIPYSAVTDALDLTVATILKVRAQRRNTRAK